MFYSIIHNQSCDLVNVTHIRKCVFIKLLKSVQPFRQIGVNPVFSFSFTVTLIKAPAAEKSTNQSCPGF